MQAARPELIAGYLHNQPLSDAEGQALMPVSPALMAINPVVCSTRPHVTPHSPLRTLSLREAVHLPRVTAGGERC